MTDEQVSVVCNRMKTVLDLYSRRNTLESIANMTGLTYEQVRAITRANNFQHGIQKTEGTPGHPINPFIFYEDFAYLLDCNILDTMRN